MIPPKISFLIILTFFDVFSIIINNKNKGSKKDERSQNNIFHFFK
ncbi:hypothetical protein STRMA_1641 [Streptococcus macacae NCTC 11558]|uniref:Uncharacterized protein n=1 Tax=Streptococcus macacae NCTC 11558 TaxID=764298 RepID=G5JXL7_9STRE|nr:hypothetical protein STRMA_1641 [Streptococcus macacae NCTC 11558]